MSKCEVVDCERDAEYLDLMSNLLCEEHMQQDISEGAEPEDFESI